MGGVGRSVAGLALLATLAIAGCQGPSTPTYEVRVAGAQVPTDFVASWLADADDPRFAVEKLWPMRYSQDGFEKLRSGAADLACTDRPLTSRERATLDDVPIVGKRVAFFGYGLYVHPDNPVDAVFAKHLELILQGELTDWSELLGDAAPFSGPIHVYGQGKSSRSGLQLAQMARIFFDKPSWRVVTSDEEVIANVRDDPLALGFADIGYDQGVRYLGLRMERAGPAALPSVEAIAAERYGLAKVIYLYHRDPLTPAVRAALDYLASDAAAAELRAMQVWPLPRERWPAPDAP
jgi:phosphate transport system substrate-binding protein